MHRELSGGAVVNVSSVHSLATKPGFLAYATSKAGLVGLTRALARDLAPEIRVNAIAPGAILWPEEMPEEQREAVLRRIPLGRKGEPEDVARAVVAVLHADFVTGAVIPVDGGRLQSI